MKHYISAMGHDRNLKFSNNLCSLYQLVWALALGSHQLARGPPAQIFWGMACFLFPRSLSFDFCYELDIWAQGQALKAFFVVICFSAVLSKV